MLPQYKKHPKAKGEKTEAIILAEFIKCNYTVLLPFGDNARYDMVLDTKKGLKKIQCKTARFKGPSVIFSTCSSNNNTTKSISKHYRDQIDYFAVYCYGNNKMYVIPVELAGTKECHLRFKPLINASKAIKWAKDFEFNGVSIGMRTGLINL